MLVGQDAHQQAAYLCNEHLKSRLSRLSPPSTCYVTLMPYVVESHGNEAKKDDSDLKAERNRMVVLGYGRNYANSSPTMGRDVRVAPYYVHSTHLGTI